MARIFTDLRIHQTGLKIVSITLSSSVPLHAIRGSISVSGSEFFTFLTWCLGGSKTLHSGFNPNSEFAGGIHRAQRATARQVDIHLRAVEGGFLITEKLFRESRNVCQFAAGG
jgi:hypothetical protein